MCLDILQMDKYQTFHVCALSWLLLHFLHFGQWYYVLYSTQIGHLSTTLISFSLRFPYIPLTNYPGDLNLPVSY